MIDTLKVALEIRDYPEGVIIHLDPGSVYTYYVYQNYVKKMNLVGNMSCRGNCWDNVALESFHSNLKTDEFQYVKMNSSKIKLLNANRIWSSSILI